MFLFFIERRKATTIPNKKVKVSKDKMMLVSRLIYTVGYDGKRYNEEYDSEGNKGIYRMPMCVENVPIPVRKKNAYRKE